MKKVVLLAVLFTSLKSQAQNYSLGFDGTDDYVTIADNNSLDLSSTFTIEAWLNPSGAGSNNPQGGMIINKELNYEIARFQDGTIRFALSSNGTSWEWVNTGMVVPLNTWSHIAIVKDGTSVTGYLNGNSSYSNSSQPSSLSTNSQIVWVGGRSTASQYLNGQIDELRIWSTARTASEIKQNMFNKNLSNSASGLVAYYRFNESSGTAASNSCSNTAGIDGTLYNFALSGSSSNWLSSPVQYASNSLTFDGSNDYVTTNFNFTSSYTAFTVEAWINHSNTTNQTNILGQNGTLEIAFINSRLYIYINTNNGWLNTYYTIDGSLTTSNWNHIAITSNGTVTKIYINGVEKVSTSMSWASLSNSGQMFRMGGNTQSPVVYYTGKMDEVRIWNTARTASEIANNYLTEIDATTSGLVAYYNFNQGIADGTNTALTTVIDYTGTNNGTLTDFALSGSTSNYAAQNTNLIALPLKWHRFSAKKQNQNVLLEWSTASEQNTKDFIIQHSNNSTHWKNIGTLNAAGNSHTILYYDYLHRTPENWDNFYRILQRDLDGKSSSSEVRMVSFENKSDNFKIMGNPISDGQLKLAVHASCFATLYSPEGTLLWSKYFTTGSHSINMNGCAKGVYLLKAGEQRERVVLQ